MFSIAKPCRPKEVQLPKLPGFKKTSGKRKKCRKKRAKILQQVGPTRNRNKGKKQRTRNERKKGEKKNRKGRVSSQKSFQGVSQEDYHYKNHDFSRTVQSTAVKR